jgi:hypothetical protein
MGRVDLGMARGTVRILGCAGRDCVRVPGGAARRSSFDSFSRGVARGFDPGCSFERVWERASPARRGRSLLGSTGVSCTRTTWVRRVAGLGAFSTNLGGPAGVMERQDPG